MFPWVWRLSIVSRSKISYDSTEARKPRGTQKSHVIIASSLATCSPIGNRQRLGFDNFFVLRQAKHGVLGGIDRPALAPIGGNNRASRNGTKPRAISATMLQYGYLQKKNTAVLVAAAVSCVSKSHIRGIVLLLAR